MLTILTFTKVCVVLTVCPLKLSTRNSFGIPTSCPFKNIIIKGEHYGILDIWRIKRWSCWNHMVNIVPTLSLVEENNYALIVWRRVISLWMCKPRWTLERYFQSRNATLSRRSHLSLDGVVDFCKDYEVLNQRLICYDKLGFG